MRGENFHKELKKFETKRVKVNFLEEDTCIFIVPIMFANLFPVLITILDGNAKSLELMPGMVIALVRIEIPSIGIWTNIPGELKRIIDKRKPEMHFCRVIRYVKIASKLVNQINNKMKCEKLIVDFTTGEIMSYTRYLWKLKLVKNPGKTFGIISETLLEEAWDRFNKSGG